MKKLFILVLLLITPAAVFGADRSVNRPYWSLELKGGIFQPDIDNWENYYDKKYAGEFGGALGYKIARQLEVGITGMFIRDTGKGNAPLHATAAGTPVYYAGRVIYELAPLNVFVLARGVFNEEQWLVPYVGGGWTRMFYREEVQHQGVVRGSVDGYHARGGLQLLLDKIDPSAANGLYMDFGIHHTYFFLEAEYTRALVDTVGGSVNLGGTSFLGGLLFEF